MKSVAILAAVVLGQGAPQAPPPPAQQGAAPSSVSFDEKLLAQIPDDVAYKHATFSRDGRAVAYTGSRGGKMFVMVNNTKGPDYPSIADKPQFSKDNKTVVYRANNGGQWHVVVGTAPGPAMSMVGPPIFAPDGSKYAFEGTRGGQGNMAANSFAIWVGGQKGPDWASCGPPAFSADGSVMAHSAKIAKGGSQDRANYTTAVMVVNNKPGPEVEQVSSPYFAPKGKNMAYKSMAGGVWTLLVEGKAQGSYPDMGVPIWDPDGKKVAYKGGSEGTFRVVVVDGKPGEEFDLVGDPVWSQDGKKVAYKAMKGAEQFVVADGKKLKVFPGVETPSWAPDGASLAFPATKGTGKWMMVIGDKEGPMDQEFVSPGIWSPDGKHVAFQAMWKFKYITMIDDGKNEMFDETQLPCWNAQSTKVAYAAKKDSKWYMVVGYKRLEPFEEILTPPYWKADGTKVAFGARKDRSLVWRVVEVTE